MYSRSGPSPIWARRASTWCLVLGGQQLLVLELRPAALLLHTYVHEHAIGDASTIIPTDLAQVLRPLHDHEHALLKSDVGVGVIDHDPSGVHALGAHRATTRPTVRVEHRLQPRSVAPDGRDHSLVVAVDVVDRVHGVVELQCPDQARPYRRSALSAALQPRAWAQPASATHKTSSFDTATRRS